MQGEFNIHPFNEIVCKVQFAGTIDRHKQRPTNPSMDRTAGRRLGLRLDNILKTSPS